MPCAARLSVTSPTWTQAQCRGRRPLERHTVQVQPPVAVDVAALPDVDGRAAARQRRQCVRAVMVPPPMRFPAVFGRTGQPARLLRSGTTVELATRPAEPARDLRRVGREPRAGDVAGPRLAGMAFRGLPGRSAGGRGRTASSAGGRSRRGADAAGRGRGPRPDPVRYQPRS